MIVFFLQLDHLHLFATIFIFNIRVLIRQLDKAKFVSPFLSYAF